MRHCNNGGVVTELEVEVEGRDLNIDILYVD
jgi:hypothetical protein